MFYTKYTDNNKTTKIASSNMAFKCKKSYLRKHILNSFLTIYKINDNYPVRRKRLPLLWVK